MTYEIKLTTYTYTLSGADRPELEVQWGDNTSSIAPRDSILALPNDYRRNIYYTQHTFLVPELTLSWSGPKPELWSKKYPQLGKCYIFDKNNHKHYSTDWPNSTPVLMNPPYDKAGLYQTFIHNPGAFDPDGDSISYSLTVCTEQNGEPIPGYTLPQSSDTLYVNPISGDLVWDTR